MQQNVETRGRRVNTSAVPLKSPLFLAKWFLSAALLAGGPGGALAADPPAPNSTLNPTTLAALLPMAEQPSPPIPPLLPLDNLPASAPTTGLQTLPLNGDWELTGTNPAGEKAIHTAGCVPGMVHPDLLRAGLIKDPFWRLQANDCQWIEDWEWTYARDFTLPEGFPTGWAVLRFEGLDTYATIRVNGETVGTSNDMFIPFEFEIGGKLHAGRNHIEVAFSTVKKALEGKPYAKINTLFDKTHERTYARKLACTFGWDWVNRFVSAGIWRPVTLTAYGGARVQDVFVSTTSLGDKPGESPATLHVETTAALRRGRNVEARWTLFNPAQAILWTRYQSIGDGLITLDFQVPNPQLWWPNGAGGQPIYQLKIELMDESGKVLDARTVETGIRTVAVEQKLDAIGRSFVVQINGTPIFCKGGNWVPADPLPSEIGTAKYDLLIGQAKEAHMNILRCWGGGIYETPDFFHACARDGIMATQDFLLACSDYPDTDPDFLNQVHREYAIAIRALRNNPALITWAGGNELGAGNRPMQNWSAKNIQRDISGPLCAQLDPTRPYFLTSPYGWDPNNSEFGGDRHTNAEMQHQISNPAKADFTTDYRGYVDSVTGRYMSEYAASGSVPERVLKRFMAPEDIKDPAMWEFHVKTNPYSGSKQTLFQTLEIVSDTLYGKVEPGPGMYNKRLEQSEYDFARWGMEASRRRKPDCSGILFWMYNDCWPAAGWSLLDYWGGPKAGWYGLKSGCQPVIVALEPGKDTFRWSVCNDELKPVEATLRLRVQPWTGEPRWTKDVTVTVPANTSQVAFEIPRAEILAKAGTDSVVVADLSSSKGSDRSWYFNGYPKAMTLPPVRLQVTERNREGNHGSLTIHADSYARAVTLDADADFSDNYFEMMPGETRTITWHALGKMADGEIPVTCWNQAGE